MKQLQKSDLKVSEIYKLKAHNREYLYRISDMRTSMTLCNDGYLIIDTNHFNKISNISQSHDFADAKYIETKEKYEFYNATEEEKHWLETCIKADKFISYKEAMKTFIPEYYEYIGEINLHSTEFIKGKTYKIVNKNNLEALYNFINEKGIANGWSGTNWKYFKPSTKEAYDAQFVVKEPKVVLEEPKDKVLTLSSNYGKESIVKVECSEGGIYQLGDKIKVFDKYSPNKGKIFTIQGFRWSKDKSKICAVTELHTPNGIGLDKIELYVEPKKELSLLEQAKLKYPIGTKFKNAFRGRNDSEKIFTVESEIKYMHQYIGVHTDNQWLYYGGKWAEIIDDFVLPEKWQIKRTEENHEIINNWMNNHHKDKITHGITDYVSSKYFANNFNLNKIVNIEEGVIEITFEQFKKYVLKDE